MNAYYTIEKGAAPYGHTVTFIKGLMEFYNNLIAKKHKNSSYFYVVKVWPGGVSYEAPVYRPIPPMK